MYTPLVSVCIPTFNGERFLEEALLSVQNQSYQNIEVIISDDGSTDNSIEICEKIKKNASFPVHIFKHKPSGIGNNWDNCVNNANGNFIKFLFQDDILHPQCISKMMHFLLIKKLNVIVCKRNIIDEKSDYLITDWILRFGDLQKSFGLNFKDYYKFSKKDLQLVASKQPIHFNFIGEPVTALFTKNLYKKIGGFSSPLKQYLDLEYWLKTLKKYDIGIIEEKLISFRVHDLQSSNTNVKERTVDEKDYIENILFRNFFWNLSLNLRKRLIIKKIKKFLKPN